MTCGVDYEVASGKIIAITVGRVSDVENTPILGLCARMYIDNVLSLQPLTHYVTNGVLMDRQPMPLIVTSTPLIANGTDEAIISGIPAGVQVEWPDGQTDIVTGGEIRFSVDLPGTYTFRFTAVPYLDKEITVEAIAAT